MGRQICKGFCRKLKQPAAKYFPAPILTKVDVVAHKIACKLLGYFESHAPGDKAYVTFKEDYD